MEEYKRVKEREQKAMKIFDDIRIMNRNLTGVLLMCERHPAIHPSLIKELENKLAVSLSQRVHAWREWKADPR
jgi:hypothetical protein